MWFVHACLSNLTVDCTPRDNAELGEYAGFIIAAVVGMGLLGAGVVWLGVWRSG